MQGKFITFEGIDGSGKSTQLRLLAENLINKGFTVITTREPGGTALGTKLREVFLETDESVDPLAELLLFAADRAQHVNQLIKPALAAGKIVISDRFADATFAYQGAGRGFSEKKILAVIALATDELKPDLTVFYDLPVAAALSRTEKRTSKGGKKNRMDAEKSDFYQRVRTAYLKISETEPQRFRIIEASGSIENIHAATVKIVEEFLAGNIFDR